MAVSESGLTQQRRGTNLPKMGDFNQAVILDSIRRSEAGLSRVQLAGSAGLAAQTVSNICRRLLDSGLIVEAGKETLGPGKPRTILRINPNGMYAVGVHIDPTLTSFALVDALGTVLDSGEIATDLSVTPETMIVAMGSEILDLVENANIESSRVAGVGVATPGPVDAQNGTVVSPPHMRGWDNVALQSLLAQASNFPVVMDKDVVASAVSEMWTGKTGAARNFVYVYMGTGIGAGLVLDDEVVRGASGNVGEIGHIIADPDGPPCDCGRRGCVKVTCMPEVIITEARAVGVLPAISGDRPAALPEDLARLAAIATSGDPVAVGILERWAQRLSVAVSVLTNFLDVEQVIFGGPFWPTVSEIFMETVPKLLESYSVTTQVHQLNVSGTRVNSGEEAFGAACLVMENTFSPNAAQLLLASKV